MKNPVTVEKKITFIVAGIEFNNLKTAQFFARYVKAVNALGARYEKEVSASEVLDEMRTLTNANVTGRSDHKTVAFVMHLQMPKPARKPTPKKKNTQVLADDVDFKNMEPAPGEQEETHLHVEPGASYLHIEPVDAFDATFAKVSTPVDVTPKTTSEYW